MYKKSQAALEFLTTYAWAFIIILIMIGALSYFGIFNPKQLFPERCNFQSDIICNKGKMIVKTTNPIITMALTNGFGKGITVDGSVTDAARITTDIEGITCPSATGSIDLDGQSIAGVGAGSKAWESDKELILTVDCDNIANLVVGDKAKFKIDIDYYVTSAGPQYTKNFAGEIIGTVQ